MHLRLCEYDVTEKQRKAQNWFCFPDANLEAAVRETIGKLKSFLTSEDLGEIEDLDCTEQGIKNLEGINNLYRLRILRLGYNQVSSLFSMDLARSLEELYLHSNYIDDLRPLASLTCLRILDLRKNRNISDISVLARLWRLEELYLDGNQIEDFSCLEGLERLKVLGLDNNRIRNIEPLANLHNIRWISLENNYIQDLSPLIANKSLGAGAQVNLACNMVELDTPINREHIQELTTRGVKVIYENQKPC